MFGDLGLRQFAGSLGELQREADRLQLRMAKAQLNRISAYIESGQVNQSMLRSLVVELLSRVQDELDDRVFLAIPSEGVIYYSPSNPLFGTQVESQFPTAAFEIEEAGKCRALGRHTACVFHLMRAFEVSIRGVARCLSIPDPLKPAERNWGNVLRTVKTEMDRRWPTAADRHAGDGRTFEALYASLDAVKNPWRNSTMHVEGKYTEEEARHIWSATEGFMRALAARCDEAGLPLA